jgi:hypothetical protein
MKGAMFKKGKKGIKGDLCLNFHATKTIAGYVQTQVTARYAVKLGPSSNAMATAEARGNHGTRRMIQRTYTATWM